MQAETGSTEAFKRQIPADLLAELKARGPQRAAMPRDLWQPSLIGRMLERLVPRKGR